MAMSPASAMPTPAPAAAPLIAVTTGTGPLRSLVMIGETWRRIESAMFAPDVNTSPPNCAPEQKPLPAPVRTMHRTCGSA